MTRPRTGSGTAIVLAALLLGLTVRPAPVEAAGPTCATPGASGTATLSGVVNTYYPATLSAAAGTNSISLGPAVGAPTPIAVGDLLLVIQMQDAAIDGSNSDAYGDGVAAGSASGWTALNSAGRYEYTVATSAVPLAGGALTVGGTLINTYNDAGATAAQGRRTFQVVRVPQYVSATLSSTLTAGAWNGSTGGVLAFDVQGATNLNGATVDVSEEGFRAGLGRQLTGGVGGSGTDYVNLSAVPFHGQKGEGIAGTPQYLYDSRTGGTVNNGADGLPNGSAARGAPATAGGGGTDPGPVNDENSGGGGGANGGAGGIGGNSWNSNLPLGGYGGTAFPAVASRLTLGAGGGAGSRNNSPAITNASSGGNGGGIVMIRTGSTSGAGTITADGGTGVVPLNDGGGGGGAGGSVVVVAQAGGLGGLTVNARGGAGADAWPAQAGGGGGAYHGPGGGGGGGVVLTSSLPAAFNVNGGANGTTTTDAAPYGATPGTAGFRSAIAPNQVPGTSSGAECTPDLTIAKSHAGSFVRGSNGTYTLTVSNGGGGPTSGTVTVSDTLPAGLTPTLASGTGWTCGIAPQTVTCDRSDALAASGSYPAITITVTVAQSAASSVNNTATVSGGGEVDTSNDSASDATTIVSSADIAITKVAGSSTVAVGSNVTFSITATNNGPSDASGVQVTDQLPAGLTFVSATPTAGTYASGTGSWDIGTLSSGASATLTITASVTATGAMTNTATKSAEIESDPVAPNNSASATITGQPAPGVPGPPNGGMAAVSMPHDPLRGGLLLGTAIAGFLGLLWIRRRSPRTALAGLVIGLATLTAVVAPAGTPLLTKPGAAHPLAASIPASEEPDKPLTMVKPVIGTAALHPAQGAITPYRIRIPSLGIDTLIESVGVRRNGTMDVPGNIWNAAWLRTGPRPGASGQAVIDGHLDSTAGTAAFSDLRRLHAGDRIYVSDVKGSELTFSVTQLQVAPLDGFPALRVFGPAKGHFLNLITCAGQFDAARHTYDHRLVVFTALTA
jgi:uncharacterized repeat protein (TIGR01451 family)